MDYATIQDVTTLWRPLTPEETTRATALLPVISDSLRTEASARGIDLDKRVQESVTFANVARDVTVDITARTLSVSANASPFSQESQSALGYTWSGTYAVAGGGLQVMRNDLKRLGLLGQKMGVVNLANGDNSITTR